MKPLEVGDELKLSLDREHGTMIVEINGEVGKTVEDDRLKVGSMNFYVEMDKGKVQIMI